MGMPKVMMMHRCLPALVAAATLASACPARAQDAPPEATPPAEDHSAAADSGDEQPAFPTLATAHPAESKTLQAFLADPAWTKRAIAAVRLERYGGDESRTLLIDLLRKDPAWQVRTFATATLARRRIPAGPDWFADEHEPRVLRNALRFRYAIDTERLGRGVRFLARSERLEDKLLAAEIGAASGNKDLIEIAREAAKKVILRMDRDDAGAFSPRLALLTGQWNMRRDYRWRQWLMRAGRSFEVHPAYTIPEGDEPLQPSLIASLPPERFARLQDYIEKLRQRHVDLAICLDCTASMSGELSAAQAGIDDLMLFVGDVVGSLRMGLVAYRDRQDKFETKYWDFTTSIDEARRRLWELTAEGGGDTNESVHLGMQAAYTKLSWIPEHTKVLIVVGDAAPHVGYGTACVEMATLAAKNDLTTHTIEAEGEEVKYFSEIAEAGHGRCVSLEDDDLLIPEIAGLTLGEQFEDEFREFFAMYLYLCR
jgi:Mg-chelatase subunit ChlD